MAHHPTIQSARFHLHKGAFRDSLCLHYGWNPPSLSTTRLCGSPSSIDRALNCPVGRFPKIRHNGIRDFTAKLMK